MDKVVALGPLKLGNRLGRVCRNCVIVNIFGYNGRKIAAGEGEASSGPGQQNEALAN